MNCTSPRRRMRETAAAILAAWVWLGCSSGTLILPGDGITGVSIGHTAEMVEATLGKPDQKTTRNEAGRDSPILEYFIYQPLGVDIFFQEDRVKSLFLYNEGSEEHQKFQGKTPDGIHLGSTRQDVLRILGDPDGKGEGTFQDRLFLYDQGIDFTFRPDDTIRHIVIRSPS